jgi:hypothetical protein
MLPCCMSTLYVHAAWPCLRGFKSMLHVYEHKNEHGNALKMKIKIQRNMNIKLKNNYYPSLDYTKSANLLILC